MQWTVRSIDVNVFFGEPDGECWWRTAVLVRSVVPSSKKLRAGTAVEACVAAVRAVLDCHRALLDELSLSRLPLLSAVCAMSDHPTLSWEPMQDGSVFYRRHQLYSISGKLPGDLQDFIVAGCRYGGPIGMSHHRPLHSRS